MLSMIYISLCQSQEIHRRQEKEDVEKLGSSDVITSHLSETQLNLSIFSTAAAGHHRKERRAPNTRVLSDFLSLFSFFLLHILSLRPVDCAS